MLCNEIYNIQADYPFKWLPVISTPAPTVTQHNCIASSKLSLTLGIYVIYWNSTQIETNPRHVKNKSRFLFNYNLTIGCRNKFLIHNKSTFAIKALAMLPSDAIFQVKVESPYNHILKVYPFLIYLAFTFHLHKHSSTYIYYTRSSGFMRIATILDKLKLLKRSLQPRCKRQPASTSSSPKSPQASPLHLAPKTSGYVL